MKIFNIFEPATGSEYVKFGVGLPLFVSLVCFGCLCYLSLDASLVNLFLILGIVIVFLLITITTYKRLLDITDSKSKSIVFTILLILLLFFHWTRLPVMLFLWLKGGKKQINRNLDFFIILMAIVVILIKCNIKTNWIASQSMFPTLIKYDKVFATKINHKTVINRGDIVTFNNNTGKKPYIGINRVIGLPNEELEIKDNQIFINGQLYQDTYAYYNKNGNQFNWQGKVKLDSDSYYLLGDNRNNSKDSRYTGSVSRDLFIGKVRGIYWPLDRRKKF